MDRLFLVLIIHFKNPCMSYANVAWFQEFGKCLLLIPTQGSRLSTVSGWESRNCGNSRQYHSGPVSVVPHENFDKERRFEVAESGNGLSYHFIYAKI